MLIFRHSDFEHRVCAHKVVLERTEYFRALFSGPLSTNHQAGDTVVVLDDPNITQEAVVACISFLYNDFVPQRVGGGVKVAAWMGNSTTELVGFVESMLGTAEGVEGIQ